MLFCYPSCILAAPCTLVELCNSNFFFSSLAAAGIYSTRGPLTNHDKDNASRDLRPERRALQLPPD